MRDLWENIPDGAKHLADAISVTAMLGTLFQMLPNIAALLTIIWTGLRIFESETVRGWMGKGKNDATE